jgi:hypothetical protein
MFGSAGLSKSRKVTMPSGSVAVVDGGVVTSASGAASWGS